MIKTDRRIFVRLFVLCEKSKKKLYIFYKALEKKQAMLYNILCRCMSA